MRFLNSARPLFSNTLSLRVHRSSSISPHQCRRSSSGRRCTLERRVMAKSQPSCTAAATSDTDPQSAVTAARAPRKWRPTLMNVPTRTHLSSRSYQVSFSRRTHASHVFSLACRCAASLIKDAAWKIKQFFFFLSWLNKNPLTLQVFANFFHPFFLFSPQYKKKNIIQNLVSSKRRDKI